MVIAQEQQAAEIREIRGDIVKVRDTLTSAPLARLGLQTLCRCRAAAGSGNPQAPDSRCTTRDELVCLANRTLLSFCHAHGKIRMHRRSGGGRFATMSSTPTRWSRTCAPAMRRAVPARSWTATWTLSCRCAVPALLHWLPRLLVSVSQGKQRHSFAVLTQTDFRCLCRLTCSTRPVAAVATHDADVAAGRCQTDISFYRLFD